jgi:hypothetical protein
LVVIAVLYINKIVLVVGESDVEIVLAPCEDGFDDVAEGEATEYVAITTADEAVACRLQQILEKEFWGTGNNGWHCDVRGTSMTELIESIGHFDWNEWSHFRIYPNG